ncbi:MAG: asparagine--tRNA ligase, partial [Elusimicrobiales bacterium]|nr:asparagine--tRNA ligase [Elusimicrobiales bacterium]
MKPSLTIRDILNKNMLINDITVMGWVKTRRDLKDVSFAEINDGSTRFNLQIVITHSNENFKNIISRIVNGASILVKGDLVLSPAKGQKYELVAKEIEILGDCDQEKYPIQKKKTSDEFLRTVAHLRTRTNKYAAMLRIRSELSFAIHKYFRDNGFFYVHTPIITSSDCEGAGQMFSVTAFDISNIKKLPTDNEGNVDFSKDLFSRRTYLTVSGQLEGETLALSLGKIYTFGPTFRAENSNTYRHASEFWMIEPEMAFYDIYDNMDLAEDFVKSITKHVIENCQTDIELFSKFVEPELEDSLHKVTETSYERLTYTDAVLILEKENHRFEKKINWGIDLSSEHERFLVELYFKKPVIVYNKPKEFAAFYMMLNDDGKTVRGMDLLVPRIGELIGGSQREHRLEVLLQRMKELKMNIDNYWWYIDLRRFGSVPHSG